MRNGGKPGQGVGPGAAVEAARGEGGASGRPTTQWIRGYAALVGAMDAVTGLALIAAPAFTLGLMRVPVPGSEALGFVRFVGVFVAAVGTSYGVALARGEPAAWRAVMGFTLVVRASVGIFTGVAVWSGMFARGWLIVTAADVGCALVQAWWLGKGRETDA